MGKLSKAFLLKLLVLRRKKRNYRRIHVHPILRKRNNVNILIQELRLDSERFQNYFRLPKNMFKELLEMIACKITKCDYFRSDTISAEQRLALTLRYLSSGDSMMSLYYAYRISVSSISNIIAETTEAIWDVLHKKVFPEYNEDFWIKKAAEFKKKWNFPHCIGAIDGKHIVVQAFKNSGSINYNYKHSHSVVLMAVADANYCFTAVDIGGRGRESDGGIFKKSALGGKLIDNQLNIPPPRQLGNKKLPFVMVGDEAFQLTNFMLRPYPGRGRLELTETKKVFNYRLSRARRIIENTFGIMVAQWRIFRRPINCEESNVKNIIKAAVCLHNFIHLRNSNAFSRDDVNIDGDIITETWRQEGKSGAFQDLGNIGSNTFTRHAAVIRDQFAEYFMTDGAVPWQWNRANLL